jgi:hypothetical protein
MSGAIEALRGAMLQGCDAWEEGVQNARRGLYGAENARRAAAMR